MSVDGVLLRHLKKELEESIVGSRIYKIYQPGRYEMVFNIRGSKGSYQLILSACAGSARIHLSNTHVDNPIKPPMLCMLFRKKLLSAKIIGIRQLGLERVLYLDCESRNEMGDKIILTLVVQIMGKYSNIILINSEGKIEDAVKRVGSDMTTHGVVLPGFMYSLPPSQNKLCIINTCLDDALIRILGADSKVPVKKCIMESIQGISASACESIISFLKCDKNILIGQMDSSQKKELRDWLGVLWNTVNNISGKPTLLLNDDGNPRDISFMHGLSDKFKEYNSFSELIDDYFRELGRSERIKSRVGSLIKKIGNIIGSRKNKILKQKKELIECGEREKYKVCGDIIMSNLSLIKKGMKVLDTVNFYSPHSENIKIDLDPSLDGVKNGQRYYKLYRKSGSAGRILIEQIEQAKNDIQYLENILDYLSRSNSEQEVEEILNEVYDQGYMKSNNKKKKGLSSKPLKPLEFKTPGGFTVYIGRNSKQNERLTLKQSNKDDIWFHTKDIPGSHTVLVKNEKEPSHKDILYAANLCALHSKASDSSNVPVDYTKISYVKKVGGGKPGMVIYKNQKTLYVTPDKSILYPVNLRC